MKKFLFLFGLVILSSCGKVVPKGEIANEEIQVKDFVNIDLDGKFRAFYVKSDSSFVNVETYKNVADNLQITVKDKTLTIIEKRETQDVDFYNITIYSKNNIERISLADAVELNISSKIKTDNFKLLVKNNAKFIGSVDSRRTTVELSQKSRANFNGKTTDAIINISDTASIIAPYWMIDHLNINSKNGNYAEVNVQDSLKGNIKNTAKLIYYNDPIQAIKIDKTADVRHKSLD